MQVLIAASAHFIWENPPLLEVSRLVLEGDARRAPC